MFRILCVSDKFKGTLTSTEIGFMAKEVWGERCSFLPLADGGEGTLDALRHIRPWRIEYVRVAGPTYNELDAYYFVDPSTNTAYLEMAMASGLQLVPETLRDPRFTTTRGTGQLIRHAWLHGVKRIVVFAGGSATHDAGIGLLSGCGYQWLDEEGIPLPPQGDSLARIAAVLEPPDLPPPPELFIATDVRNPLLGPLGAARQYAAQKGATSQVVEMLETGTALYATWLQNRFSLTIAYPGIGAAGGLALSPLAFWNAQIVSATEVIFDLLSIEKQIASADIVLTGEGKLDDTSRQGKLIQAVCQLAKKHHKKVWGVFGEVMLSAPEVRDLGFEQWFSLVELSGDRKLAMQDPGQWVKKAFSLFG